MSATLAWQNSGLGAKTGTTVAAAIADIATLVSSKSGDAAFLWAVASSSTAASPNYVVLKRKSGAAGRILIACWTSAPAGNNAAILDAAPTSNALYIAFFPAGNVDTPSNLTASSGTIMGDDTGAVKVSASCAVSFAYAALLQPFYFDSAEAVFFGFQNPAVSTSLCGFGAGYLLVDAADNEYAATVSFGNTALHTFGQTTSGMGWTTTAQVAGTSSAPHVRTNYGAAGRAYFGAYAPAGAWASQATGPTDILTDTSLSRAYFVPFQLLGQAKGEGFALKLRQIAFGPGTTGAFSAYNTTGPVVAARQFNAATTGGGGFPWFTNFKI